jgi:hypothetical protein
MERLEVLLLDDEGNDFLLKYWTGDGFPLYDDL